MGKSYAIMHWGACVNADDVEFVLGSSAIPSQEHHPAFQRRAVGFFLLDFGQCEAMDLPRMLPWSTRPSKVPWFRGTISCSFPTAGRAPGCLQHSRRRIWRRGTYTILQDKNPGEKFNMGDFMMEYEEYAEDFLL